MLDRHLALDRSDERLAHGYRAAREWLEERKGSNTEPPELTDEDREAFRRHVCETYFRVTTEAIRRYDPNHL